MRQSIKNHVSHRSSLRKAYLTNESYSDFMDRIPNRAVVSQYTAQNMKYPESMFQKPYDDPMEDYQTLEQTWYPYEASPLKLRNHKTPDLKKTCLNLWDDLFGDWRGGTPNRFQMKAYQEYAKQCPTTFKESQCCGKGKISGPTRVTANGKATYTFKIQKRCDYSWSAVRGTIVGGYYTAPTIPGKDKISVSVTPGGHVCATKDISVTSADCGSATISAPSNQVYTGTSITLSVLNPEPYVTYKWSISSGGGTINENTGVYTAPATNPDCANNATIQLKSGANVCDSKVLYITNVSVPAERAYILYDSINCFGNCRQHWVSKRCDGTTGDSAPVTSGNEDCSPATPCGSGGGEVPPASCSSYCAPVPRTVDVRTPAMKAAGCCPAALM